MQEIQVKSNEAGQRLDKLLAKYLKLAPKSFFYKMLRKKNILLNGKKADGSERLELGDSIKLFLSDETIANFTEKKKVEVRKLPKLPIIYEDEHIVLINKPSGVLSQKAEAKDISIVEMLTVHLLENGSLKEEDLRSFTPSICNRLDRNTSGLLIAGKSLAGLQGMAELLKNRTMDKYYLCVIAGELKERQTIEGFLTKNERTNQVAITNQKMGEESLPIVTRYEPLVSNQQVTLLRVKLITGRSHQIRAHLSSIGHPIIGDYKYGNRAKNQIYQEKYGVKDQLLHAYEIEFPELEEPLSYLSGKHFTAPYPKLFKCVMEGERLAWQPGTPEV